MDHHEKLAWSMHHLHALDLEIKEFIVKHPFTGRGEQEVDSRRFRILANEPHILPAHWPLMVGDAIHNLRGVLDHLICALSKNAKSKPTIDESTKLQFPACTKEEWYIGEQGKPKTGARWKNLRFLRDDALAIIDRTQPYRAGEAAHSHPLAVIAAYSNHDKHRNLMASAALARPVQFTFQLPATTRQGRYRSHTLTQIQQRFYKDAELAVVEFSEGTTCDHGEMAVTPILEGTVAFGKEGPAPAFTVKDLQNFSDAIFRDLVAPLDEILYR